MSLVRDFWEYNPSTDAWVQKADFTGSGLYFAVGFGIGERGYVGTGLDGHSPYVSSFYAYDPGSTYLWSNGATTASITATQSGSYTVTVTTSDGCNRTSDPLVVNSTGLHWVLDKDADGYYTGNPMTQCTSPGDGYVVQENQQPGDCNDDNKDVHPGAPEICGNGIDDNCNGSVDENCGPCRTANNLTTNVTWSGAQLNWAANATPVQWQVQYKTLSNGSKWTTVTLNGTLRSYTLTGLLSKQKYKWSIRAKCGNTWTAYSYEIEFRTLPATGSFITRAKPIPEATAETLIVPNLLHHGQLWRIQNLPDHNEVMVMDNKGALVLRAANYANNKVFNNAASGLYFYQIITTRANGQSKTYHGKLLIAD